MPSVQYNSLLRNTKRNPLRKVKCVRSSKQYLRAISQKAALNVTPCGLWLRRQEGNLRFEELFLHSFRFVPFCTIRTILIILFHFFLAIGSSSRESVPLPGPISLGHFVSSSAFISIAYTWVYIIRVRLYPVVQLAISVNAPDREIV